VIHVDVMDGHFVPPITVGPRMVAALADTAHDAGAIDLALCMTVNPGWGGQPFIAHSTDKLVRVRALVGAEVAVEVDGGIDAETAPVCRQAGANVFVAGSAIYEADEPAEAYRAIVRSLGAD
jgi:ribulose-phosphate 3-epimerase